MIKSLILFLFFIPWDVFSALEKTHFCQEKLNPIPYSFCVTKIKGSQSKKILYYLHGGGNKSGHVGWMRKGFYSEEVQELWEQNKKVKDIPIVISLTLGSYWFLTPHQGTVDLYLNLIKGIEAEFFKGQKITRMAVGHSMGSFNILQMMFHRPHFFERIALVCSAISHIHFPYGEEEMKEYMSRTGAVLEFVQSMVDIAKKIYPTQELAEANSYMSLVSNLQEKIPYTYISCSDADEYGFFQDSMKFAKLLQDKMESLGYKNHPIIWRPLQGKHCAYEAKSIASFLLKEF